MSTPSIVHDFYTWLQTVSAVTSLLGTNPLGNPNVCLFGNGSNTFPAVVITVGGAYWEEAFGEAATGIRDEDIDCHCMGPDFDIAIQIFEAIVNAIKVFPQMSQMPPSTGRMVQTIKLVTASGQQEETTSTNEVIGKRSLQIRIRYEET